MKIIFGVLFLFFSLSLYAYEGEYRLGLYLDQTFDKSKITHVIVVGTAAKEDSDQFFQSGIARAYRYKEVFPDEQVVIMSSPEVVDTDDEEVFKRFNIPVFKFVNKTFTGDRFLRELNGFEKIASIDYYGHSSPWGIKLGKKDAAFDPTEYTNELNALKEKFLPQSYITLNSCNSGFMIAPELSRVLGIPVSGSLTSSFFERIESDGFWYKEEDWTKKNYVENNDFSFTTNVDCSLGLCWRMKPSRFNYSSYWGNFTEGGLSFYKFFCNFDNSDYRCEKAMARSLLTFPSVKALSLNSTKEEFKSVVFDWLCDTAKDRSYFRNCVDGINAAIKHGDLVYQSHPGNELVCNFKGCKASVRCKKRVFGSGPRPGTCHLETEINEKPTTAAREFLSFMQGFDALK